MAVPDTMKGAAQHLLALASLEATVAGLEVGVLEEEGLRLVVVGVAEMLLLIPRLAILAMIPRHPMTHTISQATIRIRAMVEVATRHTMRLPRLQALMEETAAMIHMLKATAPTLMRMMHGVVKVR